MISGRPLGRARVSVVTVLALLATVLVAVGSRPMGIAEAVPAPSSPEPECVIDDLGFEGLGCLDVDPAMSANISGVVSEGGSFSAVGQPSNPVCVKGGYDQAGSVPCYEEVFQPSAFTCVYLEKGDPRDVRSCPGGVAGMYSNGDTGTGGSPLFSYSDTYGSACKGDFNWTYIYGAPTVNFQPTAAAWMNRGPKLLQCTVAFNGGRPDNLYGPTWLKVTTSVNDCTSWWANVCGQGSASGGRERQSASGWVRVDGDLAPSASFDPAELGAGRYSFTNTSIPFNNGTTTYEWDFGDGNTSSATSPSHEFDAAGTYNVRLTMRSSEGPTRTATESIEIEDEIIVTAEAADVPVSTGDDDEGDDVTYVKMNVTVKNDTTGVLTDLRFDQNEPVLTSSDIPTEQRGEVAFIEAEALPASIGRGESATVAVYLQPIKDGLVEVGSWIVGKAPSGLEVSDGDGVELELNSEFVTNDDIEIIIQILLLEALQSAALTLDDIGNNLAKQFDQPSAAATCSVPQQRDPGTDFSLAGIALISPLLSPIALYSTDWEASSRFMVRQGERFGSNIWKAGVAVKDTGQAGLSNAGAYWRDLAWAHFTLDHGKRDEMIAETAKQIRGAVEDGVDLGESALSAMANILELKEDDEGRKVVAFTEDFIRAEEKVKSTVSAIYGKACEITRNRVREIDTAPSPEAALDSAADLSGDLLTFIFTEGLMEITGARAMDLVGDVYKARKGGTAVEAATSLPGDKLPQRIPRMPTDAEISRMSPAERKYWVDKREDLLDSARREVPADTALTLDEMVRVGGLPKDDAEQVQKIIADVNESFGVDVEMELRDINPDSLPFWEKKYEGPNGETYLPTPKNELAKAKNGNKVDVMIGMDPDGLGRLAVFKPIGEADLAALTRTLDPEMSRVVRDRWNSQNKNWNSYQDFRNWQKATGPAKAEAEAKLGGFGKALAESTDGRVQSKDIAVPGRVPDPSDASSVRNRELTTALEERGGGNTILVNDASKPLKDGGHAPIISDADWHAVNIKDKDGRPVSGAKRAEVEMEIERRLARETKTFGGHGVTRNGNDFLYKDNDFRLSFLYEQLPPKVARFVRQVRNDGVDVDKLITGQKLVKVTASGFSRGYGSLPNAGWGSVGKAKSRLDLFKQIDKMEARANGLPVPPISFDGASTNNFAATLTVNTTADTVDAAPGDGICADGAGGCSLRAAVMETNALPGADAITLPAGTYRLTIPDPVDDDGFDDDAGAAGDLDVRGDLTLNGSGATVDAGGAYRIFDLGPATHEIVGVTLTGGYTETDGAAIRTIFSDLVLRDVTVVSNLSEGDGAVYVGDGSLTIENSSFANNASFTGGGLTAEYSAVTIAGGTFENNSAAMDGGAFHGIELQALIIDGTAFEGNSAGDHGGAAFLRGRAERGSGEMILRNCRFEDNVARGGGGGALYVDEMFDDDGVLIELAVTDCEFRGNLAASGGGIWLDDGNATISGSSFIANSAGDGVGGAIYSFHAITVTNSTFEWNQAENEGPAIYGDGGVTVSLSKFADNLGHAAPTDDPIVEHSGLTPADLSFIEASTLAGLASSLSPIAPARLVDSRSGEATIDGLFQGGGRLAAGSTTKIMVAGRGGVDKDAGAVALNVTAIRPTLGGYLTLFPCDEDRPTTSSLNHGVGGVAGNSAVVKLSEAGELCAFAFAETDLVIDVTGWVAKAPDFVPLVPARLAETRTDQSTTDGELNALGRLAAGSTTRMQLAGREGVSTSADAVVLNVTAIRPSGAGYVTLFPCDDEQPLTSSLNYVTGDIKGNSAVVSLSESGELCIFTLAATDLVLDVTASLSADRTFGALVPGRVLETRVGESTIDGVSAATGRVEAGKVIKVDIRGRAGVPDNAAAVGVNVTAIRTGDAGYVTLFPCDGDQPLTSSLNYAADSVAGNSAIVKLAADGSLCAFSFAETDLVIDVTAAWTN